MVRASPVAAAVAAMWMPWQACPGAAQVPAAAPLRDAEIIAHLARTISWYRRVSAVEQAAEVPADAVMLDSAQRSATKALQLAFDFARAGAPLAGAQSAPGSSSAPNSNVEQAAARAAERVTRVEERLAHVEAALETAAPGRRNTLVSRHKELQAELNLAKQVQESLRSLRMFMSGQTGAGGGGLPAYIERLERSVPEAMHGARAQGSAASSAVAPPFAVESAGIFALATEAVKMARGRGRIREALAETETLTKNVDQLRAALANDLRNAVRRSDDVTGDSESQDAQQIDADRHEIEALTVRFRQVSAALVPLREQGVLIAAARGSLLDWRNTVEQRYSSAASYLFFRALALVLTIAVVLAISELWRRGTFRYVRDARRRRQFLLLRRIVVTCVVVAAVLAGLATEVGSLATYAGFLTAGLAVALQNVILSVVAYFFLIGRYGVRVGDRVTISSVTGDVLEIGLVRIYLMEMTGAGADLHATGRVVAFSNSVVFQPAALFKQMPGTEYVWHTVRLTLAPNTDLQLAERRLMAAVQEVYEPYRESIEQQHAAFQRMVDVPLPAPRPSGGLRFTNGGVEFSVLYPAEMRCAAAVDDQVVNALSCAVSREPRLTLTSTGAPKLQATM